MGQRLRSNDAAVMNVQTKLRKVDYVGGMGHFAIQRYDESTAFGSELDETTATLSQPNQLASRTAIREQGGRSVPGEVAILCQEILEV